MQDGKQLSTVNVQDYKINTGLTQQEMNKRQ